MKNILWKTITVLTGLFFYAQLNAQVRIGGTGTSVLPGALLQLESTDKGLLLPRITDTTLINTSNPPEGMMIFLVPDKSTRMRVNGAWQKLLPETGGTLITTTDLTNNSNVLANASTVTELSFTAEANQEYKVQALLLVQTSNVNTGLRIALSGPATGVQFAAVEIMVPSTQTAQTVVNASTFNTYVQGTRLPAAGQIYLARISGVFKMGATSGTVGVKFYSEINASAVTVKAGSTLEYKAI